MTPLDSCLSFNLQTCEIGNLFLIELVWEGCNYYLIKRPQINCVLFGRPEKTEERCKLVKY